MPLGRDIKPEEKERILSLFFEYSTSYRDCSKTQIVKMVGKATNRAESSIWKILKEYETLRQKCDSAMIDFSSTCKKRSGRPCGLNESVKKKIKKENFKSGGMAPIRTLSLKLKNPKSTLHRWINKMGAIITTSWLKPALTEQQKLARLKFVLERRDGNTEYFEELLNVIHVDESWFFMHRDRKKIRVFPGDRKPPATRVHHKSHIQKLMFIIAVANPNLRTTFLANYSLKEYVSRRLP